MRMVKGACVLGVAFAILGLAGCDLGTFGGPAAIQLQGNELSIVVCRDVTVVAAKLTAMTAEGPERIWEATGRATLERGDLLAPSNPPAELSNVTLGRTELAPGETVSLVLLAPERPGVNGDIYADFNIPNDGVPTDEWIQSNGELTNGPCDGWPE